MRLNILHSYTNQREREVTGKERPNFKFRIHWQNKPLSGGISNAVQSKIWHYSFWLIICHLSQKWFLLSKEQGFKYFKSPFLCWVHSSVDDFSFRIYSCHFIFFWKLFLIYLNESQFFLLIREIKKLILEK